jgi:Uma2 family endonuclease
MAVPGEMVATKTRYTFADLLELPETEGLDAGVYEILGGELVVQSAPREPHAATVMGCVAFLFEAQDAGAGWARTAPFAVAFDYATRGVRAQDVTQPDAFFVRKERRAIFAERCLTEGPDLVIEVLSPTTRADDLPGGRKFGIYERYGVPYYWIVDPDTRSVTQYSWRDGRYGEPTVLRAGDVVACPLFPGITRTVDQLLAGILTA